ncbi:tRNA 2-thiocytidine(32) synthetase TtcA [Candidatus Campbellbacteria bacterium]|nr:MAG: tRNA 2-thiocytidine(32) synthetase TtcA [Candidatus Campbellbacteria bacterium]
MNKKELTKEIKFHKFLIKNFKKAVNDFEMIQNGDKIILGFSGGKDSTTLALLLKYFQTLGQKDFEFIACVVNYGMEGESYQKQIDQLKRFDIEVLEYKTEIFELHKTKINKDSSFCSFFSRMRRGKLTEIARKKGFNKIALGHHLDDAVESLFMGLLYNGKIRSLPPIYKNKHNQTIIRPLCFLREKQLSDFTKKNSFETAGDEMCPGIAVGKMPTARYETKKLLNQIEKENPQVFTSFKKALANIDKDSLYSKDDLKYFQKKKFWKIFGK